MSENNRFEYNYTAVNNEERKEVENIKSRYLSVDSSDNLSELRKLDKKAKFAPRLATASAVTVGVLTFGGGMAITLELQKYAAGVAVSAVGIVIMVLSYFIHGFFTKRSKKKYGRQILELSEKILRANKE